MVRKDLDTRSSDGTIEPYDTGGDLLPYVPSKGRKDRDDYLALRPPDNGVIQAKWATIITPYRASLHFRLWISLTWWRVAIMVILVLAVVILVRAL